MRTVTVDKSFEIYRTPGPGNGALIFGCNELAQARVVIADVLSDVVHRWIRRTAMRSIIDRADRPAQHCRVHGLLVATYQAAGPFRYRVGAHRVANAPRNRLIEVVQTDIRIHEHHTQMVHRGCLKNAYSGLGAHTVAKVAAQIADFETAHALVLLDPNAWANLDYNLLTPDVRAAARLLVVALAACTAKAAVDGCAL